MGGDPDARAGAGTSWAGQCRGPESPRCPPVRCDRGAGAVPGWDRIPLHPGQEEVLGPRGSAAPTQLQRPESGSSSRCTAAGPLLGSCHCSSSSTPRPQHKHRESTRAERAWSQWGGGQGALPTHPRPRLVLSRDCCVPAPDPPRLPPTLCPLQTITLHLRKLGPRPPETGCAQAAARWGCPGPSWRGVAGGGVSAGGGSP